MDDEDGSGGSVAQPAPPRSQSTRVARRPICHGDATGRDLDGTAAERPDNVDQHRRTNAAAWSDPGRRHATADRLKAVADGRHFRAEKLASRSTRPSPSRYDRLEGSGDCSRRRGSRRSTFAEEQAKRRRGRRRARRRRRRHPGCGQRSGVVFAGMERRSDVLSSIFDLGNAPLDVLDQVTDVHDRHRRPGLVHHETKASPTSSTPTMSTPHRSSTRSPRCAARSRQEITNAFAGGGPDAAKEIADTWVQNVYDAARRRHLQGGHHHPARARRPRGDDPGRRRPGVAGHRPTDPRAAHRVGG